MDVIANANAKLRVVLAGGRKLFREGLAALLEREPEIRIIAEAQEPQDVPRLLEALPAQVVVLTLASSENGADLVRRVLAAQPQVKVLVLSGGLGMEHARELQEAGACACLTKECAADEFADVIRRCMSGKPIRAAMAHRRPSPSTLGVKRERRSLAPREREILGLIAAGHTTKEIARMLGVSSKTVETHRRRLMEKLNCDSVAQLTKHAVLQGLATLEPSV